MGCGLGCGFISISHVHIHLTVPLFSSFDGVIVAMEIEELLLEAWQIDWIERSRYTSRWSCCWRRGRQKQLRLERGQGTRIPKSADIAQSH